LRMPLWWWGFVFGRAWTVSRRGDLERGDMTTVVAQLRGRQRRKEGREREDEVTKSINGEKGRRPYLLVLHTYLVSEACRKPSPASGRPRPAEPRARGRAFPEAFLQLLPRSADISAITLDRPGLIYHCPHLKVCTYDKSALVASINLHSYLCTLLKPRLARRETNNAPP